MSIQDRIQMIKNLANEVFEVLGYGFSERVYHNALEHQFKLNDIPFETERNIDVMFKGKRVGNVRADLIVDNSIVVELKSAIHMKQEFEQQCAMYMKLLNINKGLIINFPSSSWEYRNKPDFIEIEFSD